ncbi:hypothetical protein STAS_19918 [Striga asiatica]|uniref:DUF674 family protein n=1 Tax=Striga asiatica TaxID=4170 RepID=A0A5A7QD28_STRAF|nr:hypothetical protein STAS_19918 [Striga asiatica]
MSTTSSSSDTGEYKLQLKVMVNRQQTKVLFAEADSDFADVLLSFLTLPLGKIIRMLKSYYEDNEPPLGSLTTLYDSLSRLDNALFWTAGGKQMLLDPRNPLEAECVWLKLNVDESRRTTYYRCGAHSCRRERSSIVTMYHSMATCECGGPLDKAMGPLEPGILDNRQSQGSHGGVFVEKGTVFLINNDLKMAPLVPGRFLETLVDLGVTVGKGAKMLTMSLGVQDIMELLMGSLLSHTPLTDLFLHHFYLESDPVLPRVLLPLAAVNPPSYSKTMKVKAVLRKSNNELLFVQAEDDFVDFILSLLTIPLGGAAFLLKGNTLLKNIDNLYRSIAETVDEKYLKMKNGLIKPELPPGYLSKNQILPLTERAAPNIYFVESFNVGPTNKEIEKGSWMRFKDPKGEGSYLRRHDKFLVTSDLTVERMVSFDAALVWMKVGACDVHEVELDIGMQLALNILRASLVSERALSKGLEYAIIQKLVKGGFRPVL